MKTQTKSGYAIGACLLLWLATADRGLACNHAPDAYISDWYKHEALGDLVEFDGSGSYDPDPGDYLSYDWTFPSTAYNISGWYSSVSSCRFNTAGIYYVYLDVTDNHGATDEDWAYVYVVEVASVAQSGTGATSIWVPVGGSANLQAQPNPNTSWPGGKPTWSLVSQPGGASAWVTPGGSGAAVLQEGTLVDCVFAGNRGSRHLLEPDDVVIPAEGGALYARGAGTNLVTLVNCTLHGNKADRGSGICQRSGSLILRDCILRGSDSQIQLSPSGFPARIEYCDVQGGRPGAGNIDADPCFADPGHWDLNGTPEDPNDDFWVEGDYHLKSQAGRWDPVSRSWVKDDVTSPCIDAGDPNSPIGEEPFPSGGRINMGAYGGTSQASKSYFGGPACETIIAGDINGDCKVDSLDMAILARHWLEDGTGR